MTDLWCQFEFEDLTTVRYSNSKGFSEPLTLTERGLQLDTLLALSWYVTNTEERFCQGSLLKLLGRHLFEFLLPKRSTARRHVQEWCTTTSVQIRLMFRKEASRYAQLPWEFFTLPDGEVTRFLSDFKDVTVTLTRHVPDQQRLASCDDRIKVLVDVSSPADLSEITYRTLEQKLNELEDQSGGRLEARVEHDRSLDEIAMDIGQWQPDIYHFCGHGERDALWLGHLDDEYRKELETVGMGGAPLGFGRAHDPGDDPFRAGIDAVSQLFDAWAPKLVVLDACNSDWSWLSEMLPGVAHQLVERVPAVVAMRYPISNGASEVFATQLYQGILEGNPLHRAVQRARNELARYTRRQSTRPGTDVGRAFGTPVLYVASDEALCPVFVASEDDHSAPAPGGQVAPCPRCGEAGLYTGNRCTNCGVPFRCTNKECRHVFTAYQLKKLTFCPMCPEEYTLRPVPSGEDAAASALTRSRTLPQPSVPSATFDGMAKPDAGPRLIAFPTVRSGGADGGGS